MTASTVGYAAPGPAREQRLPDSVAPIGGGQQDRFAARSEPGPQGSPSLLQPHPVTEGQRRRALPCHRGR
eukprot:13844199-Alexandrium_andersonii.AAC.1